MRYLITAAVTLFAALAGPGARAGEKAEAILDQHVLPGMRLLAERTADLDATAQVDCAPKSEDLRAAYGAAFDAWISVSHLRFGPAETDTRGFALAFWPDTRSMTPKTLRAMIAAADPAVDTPESFATVSVAGRGFYALEYLLYDPAFTSDETADYSCRLVRAIAVDIARNAAALEADWRQSYADKMRHPSAEGPYQSEEEVLQEFFKALVTDLEVDADMRLGRPMGQIDKPRPTRAEVRRSGRSLRHVVLSLTALRQLSDLLSADDAGLSTRMDKDFDYALSRADKLSDDPALAGVATPQGRIRIESLQQAIRAVRADANQFMGPTLGVAAGFNSLDGD
ncbi:imelysin family protein [Pseudodonghicola flavimaris]|uniref:Imelysin family protein n=1 Tax=Pseudodonghicola flavimaris TaxID=3050036 RepID=A0ABT7F4E8_9RHOB|nr:imelysin family protein [Pseudodonghicola flavimaris]MDK3019486.1 imelysin family protein [Pseudodonghicola flavimaris]